MMFNIACTRIFYLHVFTSIHSPLRKISVSKNTHSVYSDKCGRVVNFILDKGGNLSLTENYLDEKYPQSPN